MIERGEHLRFPLEARHSFGLLCESLGQDFDRHLAAELGIGRAIDLAHAAFPELGGDAVMRDGLRGHLPPGTRRFNSSNQSWTTCNCVEAGCSLPGLIIRKRFP